MRRRDAVRASRLVAAMVGLGLALSGGVGAADAAAHSAVVDGHWRVKFTTTYNRGFTGPKAGSHYARTWIFQRRCGHGHCRLWLRRELADGYVRLRVHRSGPVYRTQWNTRAPCRDGRQAPYSETMTFTVARKRTVGRRSFASRLTGRVTGTSPPVCLAHGGEAHDRFVAVRTDLPEAPRSAFSVQPRSLLAGGPLTSTAYFTDRSRDDDGKIVGRRWTFGDPASGAANHAGGRRPKHVYVAAGNYRVTLTVIDDDGLRAVSSRVITVEAPTTDSGG